MSTIIDEIANRISLDRKADFDTTIGLINHYLDEQYCEKFPTVGKWVNQYFKKFPASLVAEWVEYMKYILSIPEYYGWCEYKRCNALSRDGEAEMLVFLNYRLSKLGVFIKDHLFSWWPQFSDSVELAIRTTTLTRKTQFTVTGSRTGIPRFALSLIVKSKYLPYLRIRRQIACAFGVDEEIIRSNKILSPPDFEPIAEQLHHTFVERLWEALKREKSDEEWQIFRKSIGSKWGRGE